MMRSALPPAPARASCCDIAFQLLRESRGIGEVIRGLGGSFGGVDVGVVLRCARAGGRGLAMTAAGVPAGASRPPKLSELTS
jgi:hypothetical protein